jgi:NAD(P)H-flavin reductase
MQRAVGGNIPIRAKKGLKVTLCESGCFLPCVCVPAGNIIVVSPNETSAWNSATVTNITRLSATVCQVFLDPGKPFNYHAGQFVNLRRDDGLMRSYSLASVPDSGSVRLELHVGLVNGGRMSGWIFSELGEGDVIDFEGPHGTCFYVPDRGYRPIVLAGTGTGLAPLLGIVRDALNDPNHSGEIHLYHGSRSKSGLYLQDHLRGLERQHHNFYYVPCLSGSDRCQGTRNGRAHEVAFSDHQNLNGWRVFLCGNPGMVRAAHRIAYLQGAGMLDINSDPFG